MSIPAPDFDEQSTPIYGIRQPKDTQKLTFVFRAIRRIAADVEAALQFFGIPPVVPAGGPVVAASSGARDAYWGTPATAAARRTLQDLGATTVRIDGGYVERYYAGLTDGGANPGGRITAGWYRQPIEHRFADLRRTAAFNVTTVPTAVVWDTEVEDLPGWHSLVTNPSRVTVDRAGVYRLDGSAEHAGGATLILNVYVNGLGLAHLQSAVLSAAGANAAPKVNVSLRLAVGDYVEIVLYNGATLAAVPARCYLQVTQVG